MFLSSLYEELCIKEENDKTGCTLIFGGQCKILATSVAKQRRNLKHKMKD